MAHRPHAQLTQRRLELDLDHGSLAAADLSWRQRRLEKKAGYVELGSSGRSTVLFKTLTSGTRRLWAGRVL